MLFVAPLLLSLLHAPAVLRRSAAPTAGAAAVGAYSPAAAAHPRSPAPRMQFFAKVKEINEANKMKTVTKGAPPRVRGKRLPADIVEVTQRFKKEYTRQQLEQLWGALVAAYGSEALAREAVFSNPQIINPSYTFCNTLLLSKDVLFEMMGKEEALDVMLKNPAVLQCGPSLDTLGPDEIKGFANIRGLGNKIPESARLGLISFTIGAALFPVIATLLGFEDAASVAFAKPLVGIFFSVLIEGSRIIIVGTIAKAKLAGDERIERAQANEARRMGGKKSTGRAAAPARAR
uniref:Uncharacterized protein n=1 Tax=Emiliania huxleyi TaxID=2903 RepID=A0A6U8KC40_EMIHU|mmetsp:Transcript_34665/g.102865  ORF Transcript_34665/g.102865 Transcript_34665/m.102865 type:complete len:290 (-) Transcript_34665:146-1015(-)